MYITCAAYRLLSFIVNFGHWIWSISLILLVHRKHERGRKIWVLLKMSVPSVFNICSAIWGLLGKDDDLRTGHELLNTERIVLIFQIKI